MTPEELQETLTLLAVIHRDGGHYTVEHGLVKSLVDARERVVRERADRAECDRDERDTDRPPVIVHVVAHGFPLCAFSDRLPSEWPPGHQWVRVGEEGANCERCLGSADTVG